MKVVLLLLVITANLAACTVFEAGKMSEERKRLYEYNNNQEFCEKNPDRCVNNIPWS